MPSLLWYGQGDSVAGQCPPFSPSLLALTQMVAKTLEWIGKADQFHLLSLVMWGVCVRSLA